MAALCGAAILAGCDGRRESREVLNMPDMHFSPAIKAQEPNPLSPNGIMLTPPEGTVPVDWQPYTIVDADADTLAMELRNPLPATPEVLRTGEKYYATFCTPCHAAGGDGMGTVIRANAGMPMPPSLYSEKLVDEWTDGRIFHVITRGQGNMPGYAAKIDPADRWAIIHYVRSIQAAAAGDAGEESTETAPETEEANAGAEAGEDMQTSHLLDTGAKHYASHCLECHGPAANLSIIHGPTNTAFSTDVASSADAELDRHIFDILTDGVGEMESYKATLSEQDRWAVAKYVRIEKAGRNARTLN